MTDNDEDHEVGGGEGVTRNMSNNKRNVRFAASQESLQPDVPLTYVPPQQQTAYPGPPPANQPPPPQTVPQPVSQAPYQPPEQTTRDINAGPPQGGQPNLHIDTQNIPPPPPAPTTSMSTAPLPRSWTPPVAQQQQPAPPPNQSYYAPGPVFTNPQPGPQQDMAYQSAPSANPMYAQTSIPPPQGTLDMPETPIDRLMRENTQRRAALEQSARYRQEQEARWEEATRLERENRRLAKEAERNAREGRRREEMMSRPPPRDSEPIFGGGARPPKKTKSRGEGYILCVIRDLRSRDSGQGMLVQLLLLGKKAFDDWEKQYVHLACDTGLTSRGAEVHGYGPLRWGS